MDSEVMLSPNGDSDTLYGMSKACNPITNIESTHEYKFKQMVLTDSSLVKESL